MDRRTFLKSAGAKGAAVMATSVVGTEMLHATENNSASATGRLEYVGRRCDFTG